MPDTTGSTLHVEIPAHGHAALDALEKAGFEAWYVGGFVRDSLMGRSPADFDLASSALWSDAKHALERRGFIVRETGTAHGTITAVLGERALEVTTYRTDGAYSDARRPDSVSFVRTIEEDLARRDFTINALAYHPERGLIDPYGGRDDIEAGIIRTVGEAHRRFSEDALRMLRACRFVSTLGFSLEETTYQAMLEEKTRMVGLAAERVTAELHELLLGEHVHDALMGTVDVLAAVLPELTAMKDFDQKTPYHIYDVLEHTAWVVQHTRPEPLVRWAALFHDIGKPAAFFQKGDVGHFYGHARVSCLIARGVMTRLALSPTFQKNVLELVRVHDDPISPTSKEVKRALRRMNGNAELFRTLCDLKRADALSQAPHCHPRAELANELERMLDDVLAADEAFSIAKLAIDGNAVMAGGVAQGPDVGAALEAALDAVIEGAVPNERDALAAFVEEWAERR